MGSPRPGFAASADKSFKHRVDPVARAVIALHQGRAGFKIRFRKECGFDSHRSTSYDLVSVPIGNALKFASRNVFELACRYSRSVQPPSLPSRQAASASPCPEFDVSSQRKLARAEAAGFAANSEQHETCIHMQSRLSL